MIKDLRAFSGGLDFDSDIRNVAPQDYVDATGIVSGVSKNGSVTNIKGNVLISYDLPAGNNTVIGSERNIRENSIIYFVYNDQGNHCILEYYCLSKTIEPILVPFNNGTINFTTDFLDFNINSKIHSVVVLNDLLFWVTDSSSPKQINKKSARDFINGVTPTSTQFPYDSLIATGNSFQKTQFIELIKYKPVAEPDIELLYDPNRKTNYLKNKFVQAKYRYIYNDNETSRWTDGSIITLPNAQENYNGQISANTNNRVDVTVNTGHPNVKYIEIAFRFDNNGIWAKIDTPIAKYDTNNQRLLPDYSNYTYPFYNDVVLIELADDFNNYDAVPLISNTMDLILDNRLVLFNNVEGYQNPIPNIALDVERVTVDISDNIVNFTNREVGAPINSDFLYYNYNIPSSSLTDKTSAINIPWLKPSYLVVGSVITFKVRRYDAGPSYNLTFTVNYVVTDDDLQNYPNTLTDNLYQAVVSTTNATVHARFYYGFVPGPPTTSVNHWNTIFLGGTAFSEYYEVTVPQIIAPTQKYTGFKCGAYQPLGIVYQDIQGRDGGVLTGPEFVKYIPFWTETSPATPYNSDEAILHHLKFTINHYPPEWAYSYKIVYALNDLSKYTQFLLKGAAPKITPQGRYELDCTYLINYITKESVVSSIDFKFEPGDRVRFIANTDEYCQAYIEAEAIAFDPSTNILTVVPYNVSQVTNGTTPITQELALIEYFGQKTKSNPQNKPFFAIGQTFNVINPGQAQRYHEGNTQTQTSSQACIITLDRGDCYTYRRYFRNSTNALVSIPVESENYSDFYQSKQIDISAVYVQIPEAQAITKRYETTGRNSGRYYVDTKVNDLARFDASDFIVLDQKYGPVTKIVFLGYTLKALQTKKNTSIYIGRAQVFNTNEEQLVTVNRVFGSVNPSELDYGCSHPESVVKDDRHIFFFDVNTGSYIQDSANGMYPISDYKARTYFRDIASKIKDKSNIFVYSGVDNTNRVVNVTFVDTNDTPVITNQTICYSPIDNRWKSMQYYIPEYYGNNALVTLMFKDGQLWLANENEIRNNFFGIQYPSKVKIVSNVDPLKVKVFMAISVYSNKVWESPNIGDIKILESGNYPQGMSSRLLEKLFRWKEGVSYASYLRDALTPNQPSQNTALLEGRHLRGEALTQVLENNDTDEVVLFSVIVQSNPSELSK